MTAGPRAHSDSLRRRLPVLIFMLLGLLGGAFAWLAYAEVQRALRASGTERLTSAATQVADLLAQAARARLAEATRLANDPSVQAALQSSEADEAVPAAISALTSRSALTSVLIYEADGRLLRRIGAGPQPPGVTPDTAPPLGLSPLVAGGGRVWFYTTAALEIEGADSRLKILSLERPTGSSPATGLIERLIGSGAVLKFGNARGDVWTDLTQTTAAPPLRVPGDETRYIAEDGEPWIGVAVTVPDAPWLVWVAVAEKTMLGASERLIRQMAPITLGLMVLGAFAVYWVSGRITKPLVSLAQAAEAIAAGDYSRRVVVERRDEIGRLGAAFNTMADRVQADHELLEQRVAERTRELEGFSHSVSHDLRAPLRHIVGFAALLEKHAAQRLDDQGRRYLGTIAEAARQMGRLVDDLLGFSRMARADMIQANVDLRELVREVVREVERESPGRKIAWTIRDLPVVVGDRAMLRVAFTNLIQNAHKYTSKRDVAEIEIGMAARSEGQHVVYVKDNGAGFDMTYASKLFGVFQRLHSVEEFEGTGIGLANVRRIIERHGGRTWAEGTVDGGATFFVTLPAGGGAL